MDGKFLALLACATVTAFGGTWWYLDQPVKPAPPAVSDPPPIVTASGKEVIFRDCSEVIASGQAPLLAGRPGYTEALDPDGDGIACPPTS